MIHKPRNAFTLVEMLVVIVLLSMLIATAVFAYKNMIIHVKHTKRENFNTLYSFNILRSSIASMVYYVIEDELSFDNIQENSVNLQYFFSGNPQQCTYIPKNPLFSKAISVASLRCEDNELRYYETLVYGPQDYKHPRILDDALPKVLFTDLESCKLDYISKNSDVTQMSNTLPEVLHLSIKKHNTELKKEYYFHLKSTRYKTKSWLASNIYDEE